MHDAHATPAPSAAWGRTPAMLRFVPMTVIGLLACGLVGWYARARNGSFGFPLDDAWIHLQFAKNLHDYGAYSYYKKEMVTSGSTSPLYTFLLALGFFVTSNEMMLSYVLGVGFFLVAAGFLLKIAELHFGARRPLAAAAPLLLLLQPRLIWVALAGMETTLFILLLLSTYYFYLTRRRVGLGISAGLALWTRPDVVLFFAVLGADFVLGLLRRSPGAGQIGSSPAVARRPSKPAGSATAARPTGSKTPDSRAGAARQPRATATSRPKSLTGFQGSGWRWVRLPFLIAAGFIVLYLVFNESLSGSLLPNTYAAKLKYYLPRPGYPADVLHFLAGGHMVAVAVLALAGALVLLDRSVRRRPAADLISLLWPAAMFIVYWRKLPYMYQQGRYLMPVLPFFILLALYGLEAIVGAAGRLQSKSEKSRSTSDGPGRAPTPSATVAGRRHFVWRATETAILLALLVQAAWATWKEKEVYRVYCRYITDREVRTSHWIAANLPEAAVVATHDIGAIAFYSGRRIVDMVGLVSPDMVQSIGRSSQIEEHTAARGATHVAVFRDWFTIDNVAPIFQTDVRRPEVMEVFPFIRGRTHVVDVQAEQMLAAAQQELDAGNAARAVPILEQAARVDPRAATVRFHLAQAYIATGKLDRAEAELRAALQLYPEFLDARMALAQAALKQGWAEEAVGILNALVAENPSFPEAYRMLAEIHATVFRDTTRAAAYNRRYHELETGPVR